MRIIWPEVPTIWSLAKAVGRVHGLRVLVIPIPLELQTANLNGITVAVNETAMVYYDSRLSVLNRIQTIMHELAHVLHEDVTAERTTASCRTTFDSRQEGRAESTATRLMLEVHNRYHDSLTQTFLSGAMLLQQ